MRHLLEEIEVASCGGHNYYEHKLLAISSILTHYFSSFFYLVDTGLQMIQVLKNIAEQYDRHWSCKLLMKVHSKLKEKKIDKQYFSSYAKCYFGVPEDVAITIDDDFFNVFYVIFKDVDLSGMFDKLDFLLLKFLPQEREAIMLRHYIPQFQALSIFKGIIKCLQGKFVSGITLQPSESDKDKLMIKMEIDDITIDDITMEYFDELWGTLQQNFHLKCKGKKVIICRVYIYKLCVCV